MPFPSAKSYCRDYREKFDLLSRVNVGHIPPAGNDKEGLVAIFLSKLPDYFSCSMYKSLGHSRYHSIEAFLKSFFKEAKATWEVAVKTQEFSHQTGDLIERKFMANRVCIAENGKNLNFYNSE